MLSSLGLQDAKDLITYRLKGFNATMKGECDKAAAAQLSPSQTAEWVQLNIEIADHLRTYVGTSSSFSQHPSY